VDQIIPESPDPQTGQGFSDDLLDEACFTKEEIEEVRQMEFPQGVEKPKDLPKDINGREMPWYGELPDEAVVFADTDMRELICESD
jgi:hypothetical protein